MRKHLALIVAAALLNACGGGSSGDDGGPTRFVQQPVDQTVTVGMSATFSASFAGEAPLSVNWTRGGVPIPGATSTTYVTPPVSAIDDGVTIGLQLLVPGGRGVLPLYSRMATLTVLPGPVTVPGVFTPTGPMLRARYGHTATRLLNGKVLLVGGAPADGTAAHLASAELYDPTTNTFSETGSMALDRLSHSATLLADGRVLIAGGRPFTSGAVPSAEIYDPSTGRFSATGSMVTGRSFHAAVRLLDGKVLIAAGTSGAASNTAELYDPATGTFSATGSLNLPLIDRGHAELLADGRVLLLHGITAQGMLYDPSTASFSTTSAAQLDSPWRGAAIARLGDGRVAAIGGRHGNVSGAPFALTLPPLVPTAQLYDPATDAFTASAQQIWPRELATATVLTDGRVLLFGGIANERWPNRGEVFDLLTATFTPTAPVALGRVEHTATLLPNGKVLLAGGRSASSNVMAPGTAAPSLLFENY